MECPSPFDEVAALPGYSYSGAQPRVDFTICEDLTTANSTLLFLASTGRSEDNVILRRRVVPQTVADEDSYLGFSKQAVMNASHDLLGAALHALPSGFTLSDVTAAIPPIRGVGGGAWTWTATRESAVDVALSAGGDDLNSMGLPTPAKIQFTRMFDQAPIAGMTQHGRSKNVWDGLVGGYLPVLVFQYPDDVQSKLAEHLPPSSNCTEGTDMAYGDIPRKHAAPGQNPGARMGFNSSSECRTACVDNAECFAYVFAGCNDSCKGQCECFLKRAQGSLSKRSCRCTGFVRPPPPPGKPHSKYWEMQIAPIPQGAGNEAPVHIRYQRVEEGKSIVVRYFNNFAQNCESTSINTSEAAAQYFANLLNQYHFWSEVFAEGAQLQLPRRNDTDGAMLVDQMRHTRVRDMITRNQGVWPRYGTTPGYGGYGNNGFPEVFTASMMAALEYGQFSYAREVLTNYLQYYILPSGGILYRGLEMAQSARMLTNIAQFYEYTRDSSLILKHLSKIEAVVELLLRRRALALALPPTDPAYGCLTGNDEADLFEIEIHPSTKTEMPFISITAEAWRGFRDLGRAMRAIGTAVHNVTISRFGSELSGNASLFWSTFRSAMEKNVVPGSTQGAAPCRPYVFGARGGTCGQLPPSAAPSERDSEPWRTYSEAAFSGAVLKTELSDILSWHKMNPTERGSSLKAGSLTGSGGSVKNGDQLMTFTGHGWAYGLLQHDFIEDFLLLFFTTSAHAYSRGSWVAPESTNVDRTLPSVKFATPSGLSQPIFLRWMLLFDDPVDDSLWICKAVPREWFTPGEAFRATALPSRFGTLGFEFTSTDAAISANITVDERLRGAWPPGGLILRVRSKMQWSASDVSVDGKPWPTSDASKQTILFADPPPSGFVRAIVIGLKPDASRRDG